MLDNVKWIFDIDGKENESTYFRKKFEIKDEVSSAVLYICALGIGVCTINGEAFTDEVLSTPYTRYDKRVLYQRYDVTKLIRRGDNAIGVHAGNGFYNNNMTTWNDNCAAWRDKTRKVAAKLVLRLKSGNKVEIVTDESWKVKKGCSVYNHMRQGEIIDARLRQDGFDKPHFDDSKWCTAHIAHEPGGVLQQMDMPPIRICRKYKPIAHQSNLYDFGINTSGWARVRVSGEEGQKITLTYAERINADGTFHTGMNTFNVIEDVPLKHQDVFICSGKTNEEFSVSFCYHGFRYVKVENAPDDFSIVAEEVHTDLKQIGSFLCDNEMLNKIHSASCQSTLTNFHSIPTDCPHREQNGWTGDALMSAEQAIMNFDMKKAYHKWLRDFVDMQRPNGQLPGVVPSADWGYGCGGPPWDSAFILIPWYMYLADGDTSIIEELWDNMTLYMRYMKRMSTGYIVDFGLGDWGEPEDRPKIPTNITDTAYFYINSVTMAKMASLINCDESKWIEQANAIKKAWKNAFWEKEELKIYQTFYACAIYQGLLEEDEIDYAAKKLAELVINNDYRIDCGILGAKYIFSALSDTGYADIVLKMITNPKEPSYAYWINQGMTTLCEDWKIKNSCNHHMYSEVDNWFYKYVGGIRFTENGMLIKPERIDGINRVSVSHKCVKINRNDRHIDIETNCKISVDAMNGILTVEAGKYEFDL